MVVKDYICWTVGKKKDTWRRVRAESPVRARVMYSEARHVQLRRVKHKLEK